MARGLKVWIYEVEGLYYICSENKGPDQLCGGRAADLRLCFRICKKQVSFDRLIERNSNIVNLMGLLGVNLVLSRVMRKPVFWVSDQVQHKLG